MAVTMTARWDDVGTVIPAGEAKYVVAEQPIAEYDNWINYNLVADIQAVIDDVINKFNANTILKADSDNTPAALVVGTNTIVGRAAGTISALSGSDVRTILNVENGADVTDSTNVNAAGAVMEADFNATTFLYATADNTPQPKNVAETLAILGVPSGAEVNLFEEVTNVLREKSAGGYDNDFVIGSPQLADDGNTAHDCRIWFDKSKGAFRAGHVTGSEWDDGNVGVASYAEGKDNIASGTRAHAEGFSVEATGAESHAEGYDTIASGPYSHAGGSSTLASETCAHASGGSTTASGKYSHSGGYRSIAYLYGQCARASGRFSSIGDAQHSALVMRRELSDGGTYEITIDGATPSSGNRLIMPANRTWAFTINIAARQTAGVGTVGDSGIYKIEGGIKRDGANNTALVGVITKTILAEDQSAWDVTAEADDTNECLVIKVNGEASKTIHWVAKIDLVEVG